MRLTADHPDAETTLVFLNDKVCKAYIAADDEEGWVEVPDLAALAPIDMSEEGASQPGEEVEVVEWEAVLVKRIVGEVRFQKLG